jgi:hypothetical protein
MKHLYRFVLFLCFFNGFSSAAQEFRAGIVGGLNGSQLDGDGLAGYNKASLYTGVYVGRALTDKVYWQLELAYSGKGSQRVVNPETLDEGPWLRLSMHYIDIPFTIHYQYTPQWHFHTGLGMNFLVNYRYKDPRLFDLNTNFRRWESALVLGTSYQITNHVSAVARFSYSILNIDGVGAPIPFFALLQAGAFNNVLMLGIKYQIRG